MDDRRNRAWTTPLPVWARHGVVAALCDPRSRTAIAIPNEPRQKPIPADRSRSRLRSPTGSPIRRSSERRCDRLTTQPSKPLCCHRRQGRNRDRRSTSKSRAAEIVVWELISYIFSTAAGRQRPVPAPRTGSGRAVWVGFPIPTRRLRLLYGSAVQCRLPARIRSKGTDLSPQATMHVTWLDLLATQREL